MSRPLCALTMGDPAGIGPETVLGTLASERARATADMVVIGYPEPFRRDARMLGMTPHINVIATPEERLPGPDVLNLIIPGEPVDIPEGYGVVDARCGMAAGRCIELSARLAMDGLVDAVVTAPINKEALNLGGYAFPGHTEFYQHLTGAPYIGMLLTVGALRVIHVTTHTAIREVPGLVTRERIMRVTLLMRDALRLIGIDDPRIAVCALNPHAGESGMFGGEEAAEIVPAIEALRCQGVDITGPVPPDTVFARAYGGEFDGVTAMYHDQGHIALKLIGFKLAGCDREVAGVNTTLGLPIIRTSVDHGTAFDIAGTGTASPASMLDALDMAAALACGRRERAVR